MMEESKETPVIEQRESIKLIKNSRGYNWEIKVLDNDIDRLIELNTRLSKEYGIVESD